MLDDSAPPFDGSLDDFSSSLFLEESAPDSSLEDLSSSPLFLEESIPPFDRSRDDLSLSLFSEESVRSFDGSLEDLSSSPLFFEDLDKGRGDGDLALDFLPVVSLLIDPEGDLDLG